MGILIALLLMGYAILHMIGLELFPFQLFPMYSGPYDKDATYSTYVIESDGSPYRLDTLAHRKFTYLMNTLERYDQIVTTGEVTEVEVIRKFFDALGKTGSTWESNLVNSYHVEDPEEHMQAWLAKFLRNDHHLEVFRLEGHYEDGLPAIQDSILIMKGR